MEEVNDFKLQLDFQRRKWTLSITGEMQQHAGSEATQQRNQVEEIGSLQQSD